MKKFIVLLVVLLLSGCVSNGYKNFYTQYHDANTESRAIPLKDGEEPTVYKTNNIRRDAKKIQARNYSVIGVSSFNGAYDDGYIAQAKSVRATIVLVQTEYTDTESSSAALLLPSSSTTRSSGTGSIGSTNMIYSGTSTTTGLRSIPYTVNNRRFDQVAYFFVKSNVKPRFGVKNAELTLEVKQRLGRNTGMLVDFVYDDTPMFYADVIEGDVITHVDGVKVLNSKHGSNLMFSVDSEAKSSVLSIIRGTESKDITVVFM
jgi:hypothetical protein